ncbi:bestrophin-4-like isoform X1 [Tachypleus tridentatus]|uniref:bestrophin-4-like isoform X1 n=1 Tax=Tachypleus tridentatus TaxID=6853 RepID=UPI003FD36BE0
MTVTYSLNVANARLLGFGKLLFRWHGSIYKLLYREISIFCVAYCSLSVLYRYVLTEPQRRTFEKISVYCETFTDLIPVSFVLGFYVSIVVGRWWQQYMSIPWPDKICMLISAYVHGKDERGRVIRRTLARYLNLLSVLIFQAISTSIKKRFPTLDHLEEAGLMTKEERRVYDEIPMTHGRWWIPAQWFTALAVRARKEGRINDDITLKALLDELHEYRGNCGMLYSYDWISVPLVYTQVVTLAIYTYFLACVMGRQYLDPTKGYPGQKIDLYFPFFTLLQFFFYIGWLKVAESLINPFGDDDDDFELNWCLDRNFAMSLLIVDDMFQRHPKLVKDQFWDELEPQLPHTKSSFILRTRPYLGSATNFDVHPDEAEFVPMETIMEEDNTGEMYRSTSNSLGNYLLTPEADIISQRNARCSSEFSGRRFLNFLSGRNSSENIVQTPKKEFPPSFVLKSPRKCSRIRSGSETSENHKFVEQKENKSRSKLSLTARKDFSGEESNCLIENALSVSTLPATFSPNADDKSDVVQSNDKKCDINPNTKSSQSGTETTVDIDVSPISSPNHELSPYEPNIPISYIDTPETLSTCTERSPFQRDPPNLNKEPSEEDPSLTKQ